MAAESNKDRIAVTLWLDAGDLVALREIRRRTGVPLVQQVRRAIKLAVADMQRAAAAFESPTARRKGRRS